MKKAIMLMGICVLLLLAACSSEQKDAEKTEEYPVATPLVMDTIYHTDYVADIQSVQYVEMRSRVKGFVEQIHIDEGQEVRQGQLLFSISSEGYKEDLQEAEAVLKRYQAEAKSVETELANIKKLTDKKVISASEQKVAEAKLETVKAKIEEAEAVVARTRLNLSFTKVKAPFNGMIDRISNKVGSLVEEGTLLTTLSNSKEVFTYFNVSEKDYLDYQTARQEGRSAEVSLVLANDKTYSFKGIIETTDSKFDRSTGNIAFRARFPNPDNLLKHGSSGKVEVKTILKNAILVPQKSTFEIQGNIYVFVVSSSNSVEMRKISPSARLSQFYVVGAGLSSKDRFIYEGIQKVKEGDRVQPKTILLSKNVTH